MKNLGPFLLLIVLSLSATGCISSMVANAVNTAVDTAEDRLESRWKEDWSPVLLDKVESEISSFKGEITERVDEKVQSQFDTLNIDPSNFDTNDDGKLQATEALELMKEMKLKNDAAGNPLTLIDVAMTLAAVYASGSGLKGAARMAKAKQEQAVATALAAPPPAA